MLGLMHQRVGRGTHFSPLAAPRCCHERLPLAQVISARSPTWRPRATEMKTRNQVQVTLDAEVQLLQFSCWRRNRLYSEFLTFPLPSPFCLVNSLHRRIFADH
jgi:hypothetical protein